MPAPRILFSHPTGNANVRHAALALQRAGCLAEYLTTINHRADGFMDRMLPASLRAQLRRRSNPAELQAAIKARPFREFARLTVGKIGLGFLAQHESGCCSIDAVYHSLDRSCAGRIKTGEFDAVYAYEDGAANAFRVAKNMGLPRFYDQPIGHWKTAREIMLLEAQLEPEWASTISGNLDSEAKTARKDEELALASVVFAASSFTRDTLLKAPGFKAPVHVIPYGAPTRADLPEKPLNKAPKLKAIYVGSLGQRKGLSYLFKAAKASASLVELTVIGRQPEPCPRILHDSLTQVRYIPSCPHAEVLRHMRESDVFIFPSLFEGFGLVLLEAMAMGLPIITTPNTAGPDLITEGDEGFIVPIRSVAGISEKLEFLAGSRERLRDMSIAAQRKAASFTWNNYETQLATLVIANCKSAQ